MIVKLSLVEIDALTGKSITVQREYFDEQLRNEVMSSFLYEEYKRMKEQLDKVVAERNIG